MNTPPPVDPIARPTPAADRSAPQLPAPTTAAAASPPERPLAPARGIVIHTG
ncbi:hypothetical protein JQN58_29570 [Aneurinibacillus sp. BA2021]|nr:hypothetical protein [Aneurinibacillus sp. BA2021]